MSQSGTGVPHSKTLRVHRARGRGWLVLSLIFIRLHLVGKQRLAAKKWSGRGENSKNRPKNEAFWQAKRASRPTFFTFAFL
jgi:hypothetical protein